MSLDPRQTAVDKFLADQPKRQKLIYDMNNLEPQFPWTCVAFSPGLFGLDMIPDHDDPRFIQIR